MSVRLSYERIQPNAGYAPWTDDDEFKRTLAVVHDHTLVDHYRLYELWRLVEQSLRLQGDILEVGVWRGGSGCLMARRAQLLGSRAKIYLCDTFAGVVKAGERDTLYRGGEHADTSLGLVEALARSLTLSNIVPLVGIFPDDTGASIARRAISLCHIDVDVHDSALGVLEWVWPRMPVGGVVVYDDYGFESCSGITRLVNDRFGLPGSLVLHNLNGHAVVVKTAETPAAFIGRWRRRIGIGASRG